MTSVPSLQPVPPPSYVRPGEVVLWRGRPTLRSVISLLAGLAFTLFLVLPIEFSGLISGGPLEAVGGLFFLVVFLLSAIAAVAIARLRRTEYVITRSGVYTRTGLLGTTVVQTTFDKITDLEVNQDVLGRIFGYGTLQVNTAGSNVAPIQMHGLVDAIAVKTMVEHAKDEALARRPPAAPPSPLAYFTPRDRIATFRCRECGKPFERPRADVGKHVLCPNCHERTRVQEGRRASTRPAH